jgi:hypothetical protein
MLSNIKCVLILSTSVYNFRLKHFSSEDEFRKIGYYHKGTYVFNFGTRYSCHILFKLEFSQQIF